MANLMNFLMETLQFWKEVLYLLAILGGSTIFFGIVGEYVVNYLIEREELKEEAKSCKKVINRWRDL